MIQSRAALLLPPLLSHSLLQPEFDEIRNVGQLRELIMKIEFGIERERLVDCYAKKKVAEDIEVRRRPYCLATFRNRPVVAHSRMRRSSRRTDTFW